MAKTSAYQLQKSDIRVNSICPGLIRTGMTEFTFEYAHQRGTAGKLGQLSAQARFGVPEGAYFFSNCSLISDPGPHLEIAKAALFLASGKCPCFPKSNFS